MDTAGSFSIQQLLLIFAYNCLRNSSHFRLGDKRQVIDILRREYRDWEPRIGSEDLSVFLSPIYKQMEPRNEDSWQQVHKYLMERPRTGTGPDFSISDARDHLRYILYRFEQISTTAFKGPPPPPVEVPLSERTTIDLINFSLSVIQIGELIPGSWNPTSRTLGEMCRHLHTSPLFQHGISEGLLQRALQNIEVILSGTDRQIQGELQVSRFPKRSSLRGTYKKVFKPGEPKKANSRSSHSIEHSNLSTRRVRSLETFVHGASRTW